MEEVTINGMAICAGVGGLEIALDLAVRDYRTVCYIEREAYAAAVLVARMEDATLAAAPVWDDLLTFHGAAWRGVVDIITAGFPCQPFSNASRGRRVAADLWPDVFCIIGEVCPAFVFCENVAREPMERAAADLCDLGYRPAVAPFAASELGAPQRRKRWWLLAHRNCHDEPVVSVNVEASRLSEIDSVGGWEIGPGELLGIHDGVAPGMDRLRACGNGVVPIQAALAFCSLADTLGLGDIT